MAIKLFDPEVSEPGVPVPWLLNQRVRSDPRGVDGPRPQAQQSQHLGQSRPGAANFHRLCICVHVHAKAYTQDNFPLLHATNDAQQTHAHTTFVFVCTEQTNLSCTTTPKQPHQSTRRRQILGHKHHAMATKWSRSVSATSSARPSRLKLVLKVVVCPRAQPTRRARPFIGEYDGHLGFARINSTKWIEASTLPCRVNSSRWRPREPHGMREQFNIPLVAPRMLAASGLDWSLSDPKQGARTIRAGT